MRESDIVHESGAFWVCKNPKDYTVYKTGITHSVADSAYEKTADGLSIAIARCDYLARRAADQDFTSRNDCDIKTYLNEYR